MPFLTKTGVVEDEDSVGFAESFGDVCLQVVADAVGVPGGSVQQPLQAVESAVACVFGQLPAVFAADWAEQGADVVTHTASQVGTPETVADAQEEVVEFTVPGRVGKVVDHVRKLPSSPRRESSRCHPSEGRPGKTAPDMPSANYTPDDASDQARQRNIAGVLAAWPSRIVPLVENRRTPDLLG